MDSSYTVIRRFTPPTCTLEISQKNPDRNFWRLKQANENYQFKLSFDDPRLLEGEKISFSGDRNKLDQLCRVVSTYIEEFVAHSFVDSTSAELFSLEPISFDLSGDEASDSVDKNLEDSEQVNQPQVNQSPHSPFALTSLVNHQLDLDSVDLGENLPQISLSVTQLFDLGSALDDYQEAMLILSQEQKQQVQQKKEVFPFRFTALVGLSAIGLGLLGSGIFFQSRLKNQVASRQAEVATPAEGKVGADVIPPKISESAKQPVAKVQETPSLRDRDRLPPPPAVTTPKPPPNIPDPAKFSPPVGSLSIPPWKPLPSQDSASSSQKTSPSKTSSSKTNSDPAQVESIIEIPPQTAKKKAPNLSTPKNKPSQTKVVEPNAQINGAQTSNSKVEIAELDRTQKSSVSGEQSAITTIIEEPPNQTEASQSAQVDLENRASLQNSDNSPEKFNEQLALQERKEADADSKSSLLRSADNFSDKSPSNLRDLVQLQEISSYFRNKWKSPQDLKQTLEYRLILSQDGSINRIIPIGKAAGIYLDRTNIPLLGEPFVSPFTEQEIMTVRLLLSPDGEVRTFLE